MLFWLGTKYWFSISSAFLYFLSLPTLFSVHFIAKFYLSIDLELF